MDSNILINSKAYVAIEYTCPTLMHIQHMYVYVYSFIFYYYFLFFYFVFPPVSFVVLRKIVTFIYFFKLILHYYYY